LLEICVGTTVLAPVYFMENLYFGKEQLAKGIYATPLSPTRGLAQVAVADIGAVAVRLLEDPGRLAGKRFDLGGDELTGNDVVAILSRVTGRAPGAASRPDRRNDKAAMQIVTLC